MAGSIIDSLYIQLGIDVSQFKKGKDEALKGLKDVDKQETEISNKRTKRTKDNSDTLKKAHEQESKQSQDRIKQTKDQENSFSGLTTSIMAFGAAMVSVATAKEFITNQVSTNLALGKSSRFIGENITKLDAWGYAAKSVGGDAQSFLGATQNMNSELAKFQVGLGGQQVAQTFARLGYQTKEGKINLLDLADSIKQVKEAQGDLVAKSLAESLGFDENGYILLTKSRGELEKLLELGEKQSGVNDKTAESARKLNESWVTLKETISGARSGGFADFGLG